MNKQPAIAQLDELAKARPDALEAALEEMIESGFGELDAEPARPAPAHRPTRSEDAARMRAPAWFGLGFSFEGGLW